MLSVCVAVLFISSTSYFAFACGASIGIFHFSFGSWQMLLNFFKSRTAAVNWLILFPTVTWSCRWVLKLWLWCLLCRLVDTDGGDVLNLVESDEEQIFQDAVPRLPPVINDRTTTLVQIHRIPSSMFSLLAVIRELYPTFVFHTAVLCLGDHEDLEATDTSTKQPEQRIQTEEPEDLITY